MSFLFDFSRGHTQIADVDISLPASMFPITYEIDYSRVTCGGEPRSPPHRSDPSDPVCQTVPAPTGTPGRPPAILSNPRRFRPARGLI
jgi:hypothetical protein